MELVPNKWIYDHISASERNVPRRGASSLTPNRSRATSNGLKTPVTTDPPGWFGPSISQVNPLCQLSIAPSRSPDFQVMRRHSRRVVWSIHQQGKSSLSTVCPPQKLPTFKSRLLHRRSVRKANMLSGC
ncbi:hypothetical protein JTE90_029055 [Oedothorax gibbosus]|uniref:Uncharacterized protein n=1 Tax=Oedothorax gibbosus TaxID=931172 RepID=A0AAV6UUV6_9ARAC|nr:hypothetical protein JTE90_029055 [Oedothorax gibbosus]